METFASASSVSDAGSSSGTGPKIMTPLSNYLKLIINDLVQPSTKESTLTWSHNNNKQEEPSHSSLFPMTMSMKHWDLKRNWERIRRDVEEKLKLNPLGRSDGGQNFNHSDSHSDDADLVLNGNPFNNVNENSLVDVDTATATAEHTGSDHRALPFAQIPNFFQAILTLVICGLLLAACLLIIRKAKAWCSRRAGVDDDFDYEEEKEMICAGVDVENQKGNGQIENTCGIPSQAGQCESVKGKSQGQSNGNAQSVGKEKDKGKKKKESGRTISPGQEDGGRPNSSCSTSSTKRKSPRVSFVRRTSGPFGDEALAYAEETYRDASPRERVDKHPYEEKQASWVRRLSSKRVNAKKTREQNRRSLPIPTITIAPAESEEILGPESAPVITKQFEIPLESVKHKETEKQETKSPA